MVEVARTTSKQVAVLSVISSAAGYHRRSCPCCHRCHRHLHGRSCHQHPSPQQLLPPLPLPLQLPQPSPTLTLLPMTLPSPNKRQRRQWTGGAGVTRGDMTSSWTRGTRGAQSEAATRQEVEGPINRRCRHDKRQHDNQSDKIDKRGCW